MVCMQVGCVNDHFMPKFFQVMMILFQFYILEEIFHLEYYWTLNCLFETQDNEIGTFSHPPCITFLLRPRSGDYFIKSQYKVVLTQLINFTKYYNIFMSSMCFLHNCDRLIMCISVKFLAFGSSSQLSFTLWLSNWTSISSIFDMV